MATSWKIQNKRFDSGPDWNELDTVGVDEWEDMTAIYWEWTKWTVITETKGKLGEET